MKKDRQNSVMLALRVCETAMTPAPTNARHDERDEDLVDHGREDRELGTVLLLLGVFVIGGSQVQSLVHRTACSAGSA